MPSDVRQRMIDATVTLLATNGLSGSAFSDVLAASGAPRGSLYHHFPGGKNQLVLAAVSSAGDRAASLLDGLGGRSPIDVATEFLALWRAVLVASNLDAGCAVAAVAVESDAPEIISKAGEIFRGWRSKLASLFEIGGIPAERASALATSLVAACEGAVILARAERSVEPFESVAAEQLGIIGAAVPRKGEQS